MDCVETECAEFAYSLDVVFWKQIIGCPTNQPVAKSVRY